MKEIMSHKQNSLFRKVRQSSIRQIVPSFFGHLMAKLCVGKQ